MAQTQQAFAASEAVVPQESTAVRTAPPPTRLDFSITLTERRYCLSLFIFI